MMKEIEGENKVRLKGKAEYGKGKASDKIAALEAAGAFVCPSPAEIAETLAKNVPELSGS